jgi:hypothetical protein
MPTFPADIIRKPEWKAIIAAEMAREQRRELAKADAKVKAAPTETPEWIAWVEEMERSPGIFVPIEPMPNWLNEKVPQRLAMSIKRYQRRTAFLWTRLWYEKALTPPLTSTLTRYGPKVLDDDGLAASLKHFRDGVAMALGIDDGETDRLTFKPVQVKAKFYGLRIEIKGQ